ncbi:hypothetical protein EWB00_003532 [Schistosoma japonicum]|uniref:Uncharacterized protein n=1 Tax=Schistosoma japonicum TaxID=6182 RepID=A0A4Z2D8E3_SCHJA|nr:hypothetical protein EWB00_003532 [Schistosoma japonicum]
MDRGKTKRRDVIPIFHEDQHDMENYDNDVTEVLSTNDGDKAFTSCDDVALMTNSGSTEKLFYDSNL